MESKFEKNRLPKCYMTLTALFAIAIIYQYEV